MTFQIEAKHDLTPKEIDTIEDRIYAHNSNAIGRHDGRGLGFVIRDEVGQLIGVAAGFTWSGTCELKQMWIDEAYRGRGYTRALLNAVIAEASSRGARRIWVASYNFQAPDFYEKAGFKRMAEFEGWPEGHINVVLCKTLSDGELNRQRGTMSALVRCGHSQRNSSCLLTLNADAPHPSTDKTLEASAPKVVIGCTSHQDPRN